MTEQASTEIIQMLSDQFDETCRQRHDMGEKKYGPIKFMEVNAYQYAMEELVDLANYARYCFIKMALMMHLDTSGPVEADDSADTDLNTSSTENTPPQGPEQLSGYSTGFFNPYRRD